MPSVKNAKSLIELINSEQSTDDKRVIFVKQGLGTFVIKELVYAYAMWINAAFLINVIRAYDGLVTNKIRKIVTKQVIICQKVLLLSLFSTFASFLFYLLFLPKYWVYPT